MADNAYQKIYKLDMAITNYKGNLIIGWKMPHTRRGFMASIKKLLRLWTRIQTNSIFYPPLIKSTQKLASIYLEHFSRNAGRYLPYLLASDISNRLAKVVEWTQPAEFENVVMEEERLHEAAVCSICRTGLVHPAYVVTRKGLTVVSKSEPTGIKCLHHLYGKLNSLLTAIEVDDSFFKNVTSKKNIIQKELQDIETPAVKKVDEQPMLFSESEIPVSKPVTAEPTSKQKSQAGPAQADLFESTDKTS